MEVSKPTAAFLSLVSLSGAAEGLTAQALDEAGCDSATIAAGAGPLSGTVVHEQAKGGYVSFGAGQRVEPIARRVMRVEPIARRVYRGGSMNDWFT